MLWAGALFFVVLASASIGLNAADALFFLRFGVDTLPLMIALSGLVVMVSTIAYAAGLAAVGVRRWSWTIAVALGAWLGVERTAIEFDVPGLYPAVWLTGQVGIYVGFTLLWDVAGELADARQAKRLFPLFTSAGIAGAVTGNALTGPLATLLTTENLLVVQAVGLVVAGVVARTTTRRFVAHTGDSSSGVVHDLRNGLATTLRVPLFRLTAGVGAALSVLFFLVFFPFSEVAAASFDTEESLAGFLGLFSSIATAATFLVSFLLANRLFTRLGVVAVLMIVAVVYVAGFSLWLVSFGLVTATLFRGVQWVAVNALAATAFNSLFNVVTGRTRTQVRDFVAAVPVQLGTVVGGLVLMVGAGLSQTGRTLVALVFAVAFLLFVIPMRRAYSAALVDAVRKGLSAVFTASLPGMQKPHHDADTVAALLAGISDPDPGRRRVTAAIVGEVGGAAARSELAGLLDDEDDGVRLAALRSLAKLDASDLTDRALGLLGDPSVRVRRQAASMLGRTAAAEPAVTAALDDADCEVRAHAARILGGHTGRHTIEQMVASGQTEAIVAALRCVLVEPELAHIDPRRFVAHDDPRIREVAAQLLATRHDVVDMLRAMLDDQSSLVRSAAARSLYAVDRSAIHDVLEHGSVRSRETALDAVLAADERDDYLAGWAESELDRAAQLHRYRTAVASRRDGASVAAEYLVRVLETRERMVERWVVMALGREDSRAALRLVAKGAISGASDVKAEALEAIESISDRTLARRLVALLEGAEAAETVERRRALAELATDHQPWFRALALRTMFEEYTTDLAMIGDDAASDVSPLVRAAIPEHIAVKIVDAESFTLLDAVLALQQASILQHLDPEELEALAASSRERRYEPETMVYEQGSIADELMVVVAGEASVCVPEDGHKRILATVRAGEPIGELGVLRRQPRMAEVMAGPRGLHAIVISGDDFLRILEDQSQLATALMATLAERIAQRVDRASSVATSRHDATLQTTS